MRTLFVGDVHGCASELEALLNEAAAERVVLVGDLFTKGPDPVGVWRLIERAGAEAVLGNHDAHVLRRWKPGRDLPKAAFRWLAKRPVVLRSGSWMAVHAAINPKAPKKTRRKDALGLRAQSGRPWWTKYSGKRLVIHGHHARVGLNDLRPFSLGLDTDCVRGGPLTGYLLEEDRLIQVPSRSAA